MTAICVSRLLSSPGSEDRLEEKGLSEVGKEEEGEDAEAQWLAENPGTGWPAEELEFHTPSGICLIMLWIRFTPSLVGTR